MTRTAMAAVLAAALPALLGAEDYRHGRVRYAEDGVSHPARGRAGRRRGPGQHALPPRRPGVDRRPRPGRVPVRVRRLPAPRRRDQARLPRRRRRARVLRLWSGALYAPFRRRHRLRDRDPGGRGRHPRPRDLSRRRARGRASASRCTKARPPSTASRDRACGRASGSCARDGDLPRAEQFDRAAADDFAMWADDRHEKVRYARELPPELPAAGAPFYDELYDHGVMGARAVRRLRLVSDACRWAGARTRSGAGCGRRTGGPGSPPSPGAGRRPTTAAGASRRAGGTGSRGANGRRRGCTGRWADRSWAGARWATTTVRSSTRTRT